MQCYNSTTRVQGDEVSVACAVSGIQFVARGAHTRVRTSQRPTSQRMFPQKHQYRQCIWYMQKMSLRAIMCVDRHGCANSVGNAVSRLDANGPSLREIWGVHKRHPRFQSLQS